MSTSNEEILTAEVQRLQRELSVMTSLVSDLYTQIRAQQTELAAANQRQAPVLESDQ